MSTLSIRCWTARLKDMFAACNEMGMTHIAMTDHGNLHGAYDFFHQAKKAEVTPIIGIEAYAAPEPRRGLPGPAQPHHHG